jgi:DNA-binding HxlR family transcriptional regulator
MQPSKRCSPVPREVRHAADLLERRWQLSVLYAALLGAVRFSEYIESIGAISPRMLTERLRELESAGLVERRVLATSPPQVEYRLTARGRGLAPILEAVGRYAGRPLAREAETSPTPSRRPRG